MTPSSRQPSISVIIPCRGHAKELTHCLGGLHPQIEASQHEILVVDSSTDPAVAAVISKFPGVRLVSSSKGLLPGAARNLGVQQARSDHLAFIDVDCVPEPGWLAAALEGLKKATVVGGPVRDAYPFHPVAAADNLLQFVEFSTHRPFNAAPTFSSCSFAIHRTAYQALGGFEEGWATGEDGIFRAAAKKRWPEGLRFLRTMQVRHAGRTSLRAFFQHQSVLGFYRGRLGVGLKPIYRQLGKRSLCAIPVIGKRLSYLVDRTVRWNPVGIVRIILLLPFLLVGLIVWSIGFRDGCRAAAGEAS